MRHMHRLGDFGMTFEHLSVYLPIPCTGESAIDTTSCIIKVICTRTIKSALEKVIKYVFPELLYSTEAIVYECFHAIIFLAYFFDIFQASNNRRKNSWDFRDQDVDREYLFWACWKANYIRTRKRVTTLVICIYHVPWVYLSMNVNELGTLWSPRWITLLPIHCLTFPCTLDKIFCIDLYVCGDCWTLWNPCPVSCNAYDTDSLNKSDSAMAHSLNMSSIISRHNVKDWSAK